MAGPVLLVMADFLLAAVLIHMCLGTLRNRYSLELVMPSCIQIPSASGKLFDPAVVRG